MAATNDTEMRQHAVCAVGMLNQSGDHARFPPMLMGSGFCVDASRRVFCGAAHVWNDIEREASRLAGWRKPSEYGVAIGFQPTDRRRAERGEVDWVGRAVLVTPPGVLNPMTPLADPADGVDLTRGDGLDLVVLQLVPEVDLWRSRSANPTTCGPETSSVCSGSAYRSGRKVSTNERNGAATRAPGSRSSPT